jgi:hypothetical protein
MTVDVREDGFTVLIRLAFWFQTFTELEGHEIRIQEHRASVVVSNRPRLARKLDLVENTLPGCVFGSMDNEATRCR